MMKVLICSDSHGLTTELSELKKLHGDMDYYIHCGDSELTKKDSNIDGYRVVKGNCDWGNDFPDHLVVEAGEDKIFVTHGHLYNVKSSLLNLHYKAKEYQASVVCFGHSHILGYEMIDNVLFINPGSLLLPRLRREKTYVILEILNGEKTVHVYEYGKGLLSSEKVNEK